MDAKEVPIEVGQVWRDDKGRDLVVLPCGGLNLEVKYRDVLRTYTLVQHADGRKVEAEPKIEVGQVWRTGLGAEVTVTRVEDGRVYGIVETTGRTYSYPTNVFREGMTLVQHADGFKPWTGGEQPVGEVDIRTVSGKTISTNASLVDWSTKLVDNVVAYRVVEQNTGKDWTAPDAKPLAATLIFNDRLTQLTLAQEVLVDLGYTYAANCWVAPEFRFVSSHTHTVDIGIKAPPKNLPKHELHGLDVTDPEYGKLAAVLNRAHLQASGGKGKERHANGLPFEEQPMASINRQLGSVHGFIYQAHKKSLEALRLPAGRDVAELLGAINYLAGAVIALESWAKKPDAA
jgi:hypothetical protein